MLLEHGTVNQYSLTENAISSAPTHETDVNNDAEISLVANAARSVDTNQTNVENDARSLFGANAVRSIESHHTVVVNNSVENVEKFLGAIKSEGD